MERKEKVKKRNVRRARVRAKIQGTKECPRLSVFRSNKYMTAQLIDDVDQKTILQIRDSKKNASKIGEKLAESAKAKRIKKVVFDRGGYVYHGLIKTLAESAREGGLKF